MQTLVRFGAFVAAAILFGFLALLDIYLARTYTQIHPLWFFSASIFVYVVVVMWLFQWMAAYIDRKSARVPRSVRRG